MRLRPVPVVTWSPNPRPVVSLRWGARRFTANGPTLRAAMFRVLRDWNKEFAGVQWLSYSTEPKALRRLADWQEAEERISRLAGPPHADEAIALLRGDWTPELARGARAARSAHGDGRRIEGRLDGRRKSKPRWFR